MWFCVVSFAQILKEITEDVDKKREIQNIKELFFKSQVSTNNKLLY